MVMPWVGYSLSEFIKECEPLSSAKYIQYFTLYDTSKCRGPASGSIGLTRRDCAWMKPCTRSH